MNEYLEGSVLDETDTRDESLLISSSLLSVPHFAIKEEEKEAGKNR
jgi:hypothetical protein